MNLTMSLHEQLLKRRDRLYDATPERFHNACEFFRKWLEKAPLISSIIREIQAVDFNYNDWRRHPYSDTRIHNVHGLNFPDSEGEIAKLCFSAICHHKEFNIARTIHSGGLSDATPEAYNRWYVNNFVDPLVEYICDRLMEGGSILAILEKFKTLVEWFDCEAIYSSYESDTGRGEKTLQRILQRYLFNEGILFPFSEPSSPSGKVDIIAGLESPDPLALEAKVFSGKKSQVRTGFSQAYRYSDNYNVPFGYLVVFNVTTRPLVFQTGVSMGSTPNIEVGGKVVFLLSIDTNPNMPKASRTRELDPHIIDRDYLCKELNVTEAVPG